MTSLKDRIAALQQKTTSPTITQLAGSKTGSGTSTGRISDKIANFEKKGGTPVPRGSFGLGAPPQSRSNGRELYGNRFASTPVPLSEASLARRPSNRVPSTPSPRRMSTFVNDSGINERMHHPRSNSFADDVSDTSEYISAGSDQLAPKSPSLSPRTAEDSPSIVVTCIHEIPEIEVTTLSDSSPVPSQTHNMDGASRITPEAPTPRSTTLIHEADEAALPMVAPPPDASNTSNNFDASDNACQLVDMPVNHHIGDVTDDNVSFSEERTVVPQFKLDEETVVPIEVEDVLTSTVTHTEPQEEEEAHVVEAAVSPIKEELQNEAQLPAELRTEDTLTSILADKTLDSEATITPPPTSSFLVDNDANVNPVSAVEVQLDTSKVSKRESAVPQIVVNTPDCSETIPSPDLPVTPRTDMCMSATSDANSTEEQTLSTASIEAHVDRDESTPQTATTDCEDTTSEIHSAVDSLVSTSTSSCFSTALDDIADFCGSVSVNRRASLAERPDDYQPPATSVMAAPIAPGTYETIPAPAPEPAVISPVTQGSTLQESPLLSQQRESRHTHQRSISLSSSKEGSPRYMVDKELPVLPEETNSPSSEFSRNSAGMSVSPTSETESNGSGSPSASGRSTSLRRVGSKVYSKRYLPGHFRGSSNASDEHSSQSIMTNSSGASPTPSPPPMTPPSDVDLHMGDPRYFSERFNIGSTSKPSPILVNNRLSTITSSSLPSPKTPDIMAQFPAVPTTTPQLSPEKGLSRSKSATTPNSASRHPSSSPSSSKKSKVALPQWYDDDSDNEGGGGWASVVVTTRRYY